MEIIPAIDIIDGRCVRLTKGDYSLKKEYHHNPLEVAQAFEASGIRRLHLVDLDGARSSRIVNEEVLKNIADNTSLTIDFGGGIKTDNDIETAFAHGASQVTGGSIAVKKPEIFARWLSDYGPEKIILGADVLDGKVATSGWQEINDLDLFSFLEGYLAEGVSYVICTDISRDGVLSGPSIELYREVMKAFPGLKLIASGGVSSLDDVKALQQEGLFGAIIGKAIYENKIKLEDLVKLV